MIDERFAIIGALLNLSGCLIYFISTLQGKTKPNKVTWFLWTTIPLIAFFAQIQQGVGLTSLFTLSNAVGPILVLFGSFLNKQAHWKITRFDIVCGILALTGLFFWYITRVGNIAIMFSIAADFLAALPTIVKSYKAPETENAGAFFLGGLGGLVTIFTIKSWLFAYYGFALYIVLSDFIIFTLIQSKIGKYISRK